MSKKYVLIDYTDEELDVRDLLLVEHEISYTQCLSMSFLNQTNTAKELKSGVNNIAQLNSVFSSLVRTAWMWYNEYKNQYDLAIIFLLPNNPILSFLLAKRNQQFPQNTYFMFNWGDDVCVFHKKEV